MEGTFFLEMFSMDIVKDIGIMAVLWHLTEHGFEVQQVAKEETVATGCILSDERPAISEWGCIQHYFSAFGRRAFLQNRVSCKKAQGG
jgi:hypothetical protein